MRIAVPVFAFWLAGSGLASAWGPDGHSTVAEIAQPRLSPPALAMVDRLLGGRSLASVANWADDERDTKPETTNWHFANIPIKAEGYVPSRDCAPSRDGDCVVAELDRLRSQLRCAEDDEGKIDALRYAVHFVGDIHQPLHVILDAEGGNTIHVAVYIRGVECTGKCVTPAEADNLHAVWDTTLIDRTVWNWGAMVDRVESGWLASDAAKAPGIDGGTPTDWVNQTFLVAKEVWAMTPANFVIDQAYYEKTIPIVERQLGLAGIRLARFLNEAYSSEACPVP